MAISFGNPTTINNNSYVPSSSNNESVANRNADLTYQLPIGSTLSGEVMSRDGDTITLKLSNNQTISARLESNSDINIGNRMIFEITNGGANQTLLRPLFANLDARAAVNAALRAANLPLTDINISFTNQMMNEQMAVNKNALLDMAKTVYSFPNANPATIVSLENLGIPISYENIISLKIIKALIIK